MNSYEMELFLIHQSPSVKYILVVAQKERATELQAKLDNFRKKLMGDLMIDVRDEQGPVFAGSDCPICLIRGTSRHRSSRWAVCYCYRLS